MSNELEPAIPVWTLATKECDSPVQFGDGLTPQRLAELRSALSVLADSPITTLEVRPKPADYDTSRGMALSHLSPLAQQLSTLTQNTTKVAQNSGETLYRMVVPSKVTEQVGAGILNAMPSKAVAGGVHGALVNAGGKIGAQASFVPVAKGAAGGSAATAGVAVAGAGALTVAAPLILLTLAAGASAYADHQRQVAIDRIQSMLLKAEQDRLDHERNKLDGCRNAIDKATAVLLDRGKVGLGLGLDTAVIDTAIAAAERRAAKWQSALNELPEGKVEIGTLTGAIDGIDDPNSEFYAHLELAELAIALKRRVLILQAVEHAQLDEGNLFENFTAALTMDSQNLQRLVSDLDHVRLRLSTMQLDRGHGFRDFTFSSSSVDTLLDTTHRLRALGDKVSSTDNRGDVAIDVVQKVDGNLIVLPPVRAN